MFTKKVISSITLVIAAVIMLSTTSIASPFDDKTVKKARKAVENASPDDWHTLAKSAEKCIKKEVNLKEAAQWLDKSIQIKATTYNLTLKGDYYKMNRLPDKALEYYLKAMKVAKENDNNANLTDIQKKISTITKIGG